MNIRIIYFLAALLIPHYSAQAQNNYPMQAQEVAPGVYAVITPTRELPNPQNRGWNSNSAFVVTDNGVLLFDTGSSTEIGQSLMAVIASVTSQPVRWIINSHEHGDHWLGNAAFADSVEKIYATSTVRKKVAADGQSWVDRFQRMTDGATGTSTVTAPDTTIDQRTEITLAGTQLVMFPSGDSHSPGDLLLWLPQEKVLLSGDVVYSDRMPSTHASNLPQWISMLGELEKMQPVVVVPGHGKVTDLSGIKRLRMLLSDFWNAVELQYQQGKSDYEMVQDVTAALASYRDLYPGLDEKIKRDISHVYLQVEAAAF
jgi:glyoxylase-like metal-dependent hydrolase (beta-lactamase superfamily II)